MFFYLPHGVCFKSEFFIRNAAFAKSGQCFQCVFGNDRFCFFITYAVGQLVNGFLADSMSPFRFIIFGLIGTVLANAGIAFCNSLALIPVLWAVNGYFQSIFWASLTRLLSFNFEKKKYSVVATVMSSSMVGRFIIAWVVLGRVLGGSRWNWFFWVPAFLGTALLAVWIVAAYRLRGHPVPCQKLLIGRLKESIVFLIRQKIQLICLICFCLGFVKESISVWGPTITGYLLGVDIKSSALVLLTVPFANLVGMFLAKGLIDRFKGNEMKTLIFLFGGMAAASVLLFLFQENMVAVTVILLAAVSAMSYGCNSILLSFIPLMFSKYNLVSTLAGILDFASYIGAALSSLVLGMVLTNGNWFSAALIWAVMAAAAVVLCVITGKKLKRREE